MSKFVKEMLTLILVVLASTAIMWGLLGSAKILENFDGPYYGVIAKTWYDKKLIGETYPFTLPLEYYAAHLPLFPAFMSVFSLVTGSVLSGGVLANLLGTIVGVIVVYTVWTKNKWSNPFWVSMAWLFIWPRMWAVRSIASPETIFITLIISSLYFFDKKKYFFAGLFGGLAVLTKTPGLLLFAAYGLWWIEKFIKTKKLDLKVFPTILIPLSFLIICVLYYFRMGDFFAYFNSGDNIHLQILPFKIFDSTQSWVGSFWLEDVMWTYLVSGIGVYFAFRKNRVWGWFGLVFWLAIAFVSHRDISRYSLPLVPVVLLGISDLFDRKEFRVALLLWIIPMAAYTYNFLNQNTVQIASFAPFLSR